MQIFANPLSPSRRETYNQAQHNNSAFWAQSVKSVWILQQPTIIFLQNIHWLVS